MVSRAERIDEALLLVAGGEGVLWALALNEIPVRRTYIEAVTGLSERVVVKALARLANAGLLAPTKGLRFELESPEMARDVRERVPPGERRQIHEESLRYEFPPAEDPGPTFRLVHLMGADRVADAGKLMLEILSHEPPQIEAGRAATLLEELIRRIDDVGDEPLGLMEGLKLAWLRCGMQTLGPRKLRALGEDLKAAGLVGAAAATLDALLVEMDRELAARAARRKAQKKAVGSEETA
ncbi:MAG TPA: hypothetical protein ENK43_09365 [Planctomycetes bacterium]|nr:hypothetical protein [Planctomycetota bacterium]